MSDEIGANAAGVINFTRRLYGADAFRENGIIAREVAHEPVENKGKEPRSSDYYLDERSRDSLLVHGRQDASHALLNTKTIMDDVAALRRELRAWRVVGLVALALLAWIAWHVAGLRPTYG